MLMLSSCFLPLAGLRLISEEDYERLSKEIDVEGLAALTDSISLHEDAEAKRSALLEALDDLDQKEIDAQLEKQRQLKQVRPGFTSELVVTTENSENPSQRDSWQKFDLSMSILVIF